MNEFDRQVRIRKEKINHIVHGPPDEALQLWRGDEEDWAVLGAFAARPDLPVTHMEALHARNSWFLNLTLCHNPGTPLALLYRLAKLQEGERVPSFVDDCESKLGSDDITCIARTVLRRRKMEK